MTKPTLRLYDADSKQKTFSATVLQCKEDGKGFLVLLDQTAFFPEGGGQYADTGILEDASVLDVQINEGNEIWHKTDKPLKEGNTVTGTLDWEKRFSRMQSHTGEHIVSGLTCSTFHCNNIGFHLGDDDVTCDYDVLLSEDDVKQIEQRANEAVWANLPVLAEYPNPEVLPDMEYRSKLDLTEDVRIVTIPGIDVCACCAPHVSQTGEIGCIKITRFEKSHGGTRLHLRCGKDALSDYEEKQDNILRVMDLLSAPQEETADAVEQLVSAYGDTKHELSVARTQIADAYLSAYKDGKDLPIEGNLVLYLPDADTDTLRALANGGRELCTGVCVALTDHGRYMITSAVERPLAKLCREWNQDLSGRGGGKDNMVQGAFSATPEDVRAYFARRTL